jgi:hypothetical protein
VDVTSIGSLTDPTSGSMLKSTMISDGIIDANEGQALRCNVPTHVEVARQEDHDYEPASVLLERIRVAREGSGTNKVK